MNKIIICIFLLAVVSCKQKSIFDENISINSLIEKNIAEYILVTVKNKQNTVLSFKRDKKGDTVEFTIYAHNSIYSFKDDSVFYRFKYLDVYIYSNFKNASFQDSCDLYESAKFLNKDEYEFFKKTNTIPPPFLLSDIKKMKLIFVKEKFIKKLYYY